MSKYSLTHGCDPEVFATYLNNGQEFVMSPALLEKDFGIVPVVEDKKHPVYILKEKEFSWMMDGVAFELTTLKYFTSPKEMYNLIQESLETLQDFLLKSCGGNINLRVHPTVDIDTSIYEPFLETSDKIYQGFIYGCDPDMDAISPNYICITKDASRDSKRYGGGHLHLGSQDAEIRKILKGRIIPAIQLMAIFHGNISTAFSKFPEEEKIRVGAYGRPGRYRPQKWGLEYRTPSNSWINNLNEVELFFAASEKIMESLLDVKIGKTLLENYLDTSSEYITTVNQDGSMGILKEVLF